MSGGDPIHDAELANACTKKKVKRKTLTEESRPYVIAPDDPASTSSTQEVPFSRSSVEHPSISPRKSTKIPGRQPTLIPSSNPVDENSTPTHQQPEQQQKPPSSSSSCALSSYNKKSLDADEARNTAKKRVRERKLREQQERQKELLEVDQSTDSPTRRRRSDITPEEGRSRAIARVRLRELQKKAALMGGTPVDDEATVSHISIQKIMATLDMDAESCRSYLLAGEKELLGDDHSMATSTASTRRSVTIPKGPNFLLDQKYGHKGSRSPRRNIQRGLLDPDPCDDASSLAQSTVAFVDTLRHGEDHSTWYEGRRTVPNPPRFHARVSSRPQPKSTEEIELEQMKQHKFKARPLPKSNSISPQRKTTTAKPWAPLETTPETSAATKPYTTLEQTSNGTIQETPTAAKPQTMLELTSYELTPPPTTTRNLRMPWLPCDPIIIERPNTSSKKAVVTTTKTSRTSNSDAKEVTKSKHSSPVRSSPARSSPARSSPVRSSPVRLALDRSSAHGSEARRISKNHVV